MHVPQYKMPLNKLRRYDTRRYSKVVLFVLSYNNLSDACIYTIREDAKCDILGLEMYTDKYKMLIEMMQGWKSSVD